MHPVYREVEMNADLCQGDIIGAVKLRPSLKGHHDYMAQREDFQVFCVLTQTCDLVRDQNPAEYVTLAVVRLLTNVFERGSNRKSVAAILERIVGYQQNRRHYFYLPVEPKAGITAPSVVDLRVTFSLHVKHYEEIVRARNIGMEELFAANLGWMTSYLFSRIAMPGWDDIKTGQTRDEHIEGLLRSIQEIGVSNRSQLEKTHDDDATQRVVRLLEGQVFEILQGIDRKLDALHNPSV